MSRRGVDWIAPPGDTIADRLEDPGWSVSEFAERAGISPDYAQALVDGRSPLTSDDAERLAASLGSTRDRAGQTRAERPDWLGRGEAR